MNIITEGSPFFLIGLHVFDDELFGLSLDGNQIYKMDLNNGFFSVVGNVEEKPKINNRLYHYVAIKNAKSYYVPFNGSNVAIYDHYTHNFDYIPVDIQTSHDSRKTGRFYNIAFYGNKFFLIPFGYKAILCFDEDKKSWHVSADLCNEFDETKTILFSRFCQIDERNLVLPSLSSNALFIFDMQTENISKKLIGDDNSKFSAVEYYDNKLWIVTKNKLAIYEYDLISDELCIYDSFPVGCKESSRHCFDDKSVMLFEEYLYCFPAGSNMAVRMNLKTKNIEKIEEFEELCSDKMIDWNSSIFDGCARNGDDVYLHHQLNKIVKYGIRTHRIELFDRELSLGGWLKGLMRDREKTI